MLVKRFLFSFLILILQDKVHCHQGGLFSVVVSVHEAAQNAWEAKDIALQSVSEKGLDLLAKKLCFSKDEQRCIEALKEDGGKLVESIQIKEQVFFQNTFKAQVLCHFSPQKVKHVFQRHRIPCTIKDAENIILIIDSSKSQIARESLQEIWAKLSTHFLQFHTGFSGLQEKILWKNYLNTQNTEPVLSYYASESQKQTLVWVEYRTDDFGQHSAHFFLVDKNNFEPICSCSAEESQNLREFVSRQAEVLSDWWKAQSYVKPWETYVSLQHKDFQDKKEWFDFKTSVENTFFVNKQAIFSLSRNKGCVAAEMLRPYQQRSL